MSLIVGDVLVFLLATIGGFTSHDSLTGGNVVRILATFVPFLVAWFLHAGLAGAYDPRRLEGRSRVLRPVLIAILAAPTGSLLRGIWLGSVVQTTFVMVMAGITGLGIGVWRGLEWILASRRMPD